MARYKLTSSAGVVHVDGTQAKAKKVANALARATGHEVKGELVAAPKRRRKPASAKAAAPARRKKRRVKRAAPRRRKRRSTKASSTRKRVRRGRRKS